MFLKDFTYNSMYESDKYIVQGRKSWLQKISAEFPHSKGHNSSLLSEVRMLVAVENSWCLAGAGGSLRTKKLHLEANCKRCSVCKNSSSWGFVIYILFLYYMLIQSSKGDIPLGLMWVRDGRAARQEAH